MSDRQRGAAKALKATQASGPTATGVAAVKTKTTTTPTHKKPSGQRIAPPPGRSPDTSNLGPNGEILFEILLTPDQVALLLDKPKSTLYAWRTRGQSPRAIKVGSDPLQAVRISC